jgi:hypothetical protein
MIVPRPATLPPLAGSAAARRAPLQPGKCPHRVVGRLCVSDYTRLCTRRTAWAENLVPTKELPDTDET